MQASVDYVALAVSFFALIVSGTTLWLTHFRKVVSMSGRIISPEYDEKDLSGINVLFSNYGNQPLAIDRIAIKSVNSDHFFISKLLGQVLVIPPGSFREYTMRILIRFLGDEEVRLIRFFVNTTEGKEYWIDFVCSYEMVEQMSSTKPLKKTYLQKASA